MVTWSVLLEFHGRIVDPCASQFARLSSANGSATAIGGALRPVTRNGRLKGPAGMTTSCRASQPEPASTTCHDCANADFGMISDADLFVSRPRTQLASDTGRLIGGRRLE